VTPAEVAALLEASARSFKAELSALTAEAAVWHPAPGEWCVNECLGHIIETEKHGFAGRIRIILESDEPTLRGWDQVEVARVRDDCHRKPSVVLAELLAIRKESVALVRSLGPEQMTRGGIHERVGRLTVTELIYEWVHHDRNHLRQALANVQAYVWPLMGNAQRFTTG
jgi:hypothetical protein